MTKLSKKKNNQKLKEPRVISKSHLKQDQDWHGEVNTYHLLKSPRDGKKYRIITPNNTKIDFGASGYSNYTIHKNPKRMRLYIIRHGGIMTQKTIKEGDLHNSFLKITKSRKEEWSKTGMNTAGFWSRWLLWSQPNIRKAKTFLENKYKIKIKYTI